MADHRRRVRLPARDPGLRHGPRRERVPEHLRQRPLNRYYSEKWDSDEVATATTRDGTTLTLRCGNELYGVIHTAHRESTGTGHPIERDGSENASFTTCFRRTISEGTTGPDGDRLLAVRHYGHSGARSYVRYGRDGTVYSVYTSAPSNEWAGCAR
ncbi:MAG: hypothetical protein ACT4RN_08810 [Pseudonocardia sp.]